MNKVVASKTSILVIDTNANTAYRLRKILENHPVEIDAASNAAEVMTKLHKKHDIIIIDINMGVDDGFDIIQRINEHAPGAVVIIATSTNTRKAFCRGIRLGASDYILKPYDDKYFITKLNQHIKTISGNKNRVTQDPDSIIFKHLEKAIKNREEMLVGLIVVYQINNPTLSITSLPLIKGFYSKLDKLLSSDEVGYQSIKLNGETVNYGVNGKVLIIDGIRLSEKEYAVQEIKRLAESMLEGSDFSYEMEFLNLPYELKGDDKIISVLSQRIEENMVKNEL